MAPSSTYRAVSDHSNIVKKLEADGGVAVTTELILPISSRDDEDAALQTAHQMCEVLTLLSGNRINWINYSAIASDGSILSMVAQNAVTRSYQTTDLLSTLSDRDVKSQMRGTSYAPIINRMMERFESKRHKWNLTEIINSFHEAISSDHFLEQQGRLLANCMEMLRQNFLQHTGDEFFLPADEFAAKQKAVLRDVKKLLKEDFPEQADWTPEQRKAHGAKLSLMSTHAKGFNRYGFKHVLEQMAEELSLFSQSVHESLRAAPDPRGFLMPLHLDPTAGEVMAATSQWAAEDLVDSIATFVALRDQLTHQGRFLVPPEKAEWTEQMSSQYRWKQERFMERFVAAYLSTILGWHQPLPTPPSLPVQIQGPH